MNKGSALNGLNLYCIYNGAKRVLSVYDDLLRFHAIAVDKAQDIHAWCHLCGRDGVHSVSTGDDASHHINHLQGGAFNISQNDDVAIVDKRKGS